MIRTLPVNCKVYSPRVLTDVTNLENGLKTEILEAEEIFVVLYQNKPFNLKISNQLKKTLPRYMKFSFVNEHSAVRLAKNLNEKFNTADFKIFAVKPYRYVDCYLTKKNRIKQRPTPSGGGIIKDASKKSLINYQLTNPR